MTKTQTCLDWSEQHHPTIAATSYGEMAKRLWSQFDKNEKHVQWLTKVSEFGLVALLVEAVGLLLVLA